MRINKEFEAGERATFALKFVLQEDPDKGASIDPDLALSWGGFQLWVEGKNLCAHSEKGEIVDTVYWYLLPLMEWLTGNWDALLHEERLPNGNQGDNAWTSLEASCFPPPAIERDEDKSIRWEEAWSKWWQRHCLRACREGGIIPDVVIRRWRDEVEISWGPSRLSGMPEDYHFQSWRGFSRVPPEAVARTFFDVLVPAVEYMKSLNPKSQRLTDLSSGVNGLCSKKRNERLMWLAGFGIDRKSVAAGWQRIKNNIAQFREDVCEILNQPEHNELVVTGSCHAALMFGTVSPEIRDSDVGMLAGQLVELSDASGDPEQLQPFIRRVALEPYPWKQGYELAEGFIHESNLLDSEDQFIDVERLIGSLGIRSGHVTLTDSSIRGISIAGSRHRPGVMLNTGHDANRYQSGRRFSLAHELCHILYDRDLGRPLALASGPWAPRDIERRANAFAAMLLMPTLLLDSAIRRLNIALESLEAIVQLAKQFRTSFDAALWHLHNLGYLDESAKERIAREAERGTALSEESES
jgi:hypothetical protein